MLFPFKPQTFVQVEYENNMRRAYWGNRIHRRYGVGKVQKSNAYSTSGTKK
jgi:hypothetical protein